MSDTIRATAAEQARRIAAGEQSAEEITRAHLDRIAAVDGKLNAFLSVDAERALAQARAVDAKRAAGEPLSPLAGVPIGVKDLFCYDQMPTTAASRMLQDWVPPYNSTVVQRLLDAGLVILGKTNLDEFAMGSSTETSAFGPTLNPWDTTRVPGGSGGGSAAALAAYEAPLAIGTDTGGSIREPAAVTGTVGIKPTYGGVSRYGVIAMASSLDQPGPCARNTLDAALLHQVIGGYDPADSTSMNAPLPDVVAAARKADIKGLRVGVVKEFSNAGYEPGVEARFREAVELLAELGAEVRQISCPSFVNAMAAYYLIMPAEVSSNMARYDGMRYGLRVGDDGAATAERVMRASRSAGFGDEVKRRIILGTYALSAGNYDQHYGAAQRVRTLAIRDFQAAFAECDVLISPATPSTAFKIGERIDDPLVMYTADLCTIPANLAGNAAASFPIGLSPDNGMPVGLQVMAPSMADDRLYLLGGALEAALNDRWGGPLLDQAPALEEVGR